MIQKKVSIYTELANKYSLPYQVIEVICNSPFKFANEIISDPIDVTPIMFAYLFKLKVKHKFEEDKKKTFKNTKEYVRKQ